MNLTGVSHLFIVPRIRSTHYISRLSNAFPALRDSSPGDIQEPVLPLLRNLVVLDNCPDEAQFPKELDRLKCAVDFRDIMIWEDGAKEKKMHHDISKSLHKDEVVSLVFTRFVDILCFLLSFSKKTQWNNRCTESCIGMVHRSILSLHFPHDFHQLTHSNMLNNALSIGRRLRLTSKDVVCKRFSTLLQSSFD